MASAVIHFATATPSWRKEGGGISKTRRGNRRAVTALIPSVQLWTLPDHAANSNGLQRYEVSAGHARTVASRGHTSLIRAQPEAPALASVSLPKYLSVKLLDEFWDVKELVGVGEEILLMAILLMFSKVPPPDAPANKEMNVSVSFLRWMVFETEPPDSWSRLSDSTSGSPQASK